MEKAKIKRLSIDEAGPLVPLSRRVPIFYLERSKVVREDNDVKVLSEETLGKAYSLPIGSIGVLLLGPGCSITTEAARIATSRGCLISISGGGGSPVFLVSTQHRSPKSRIRQHEVVFDPVKRKEAADVLFEARRKLISVHSDFGLPDFPRASQYSSINSMLAAEGAWAKKAYDYCSVKFGIEWEGKAVVDKKGKHPLLFLNHLAYSIADLAILHLGYDPNIGILHGRTHGGGLSYDLADVFKPVITLVPAFLAQKNGDSLSKIKAEFLKDIYRFDVIDLCIKVLSNAFNR